MFLAEVCCQFKPNFFVVYLCLAYGMRESNNIWLRQHRKYIILGYLIDDIHYVGMMLKNFYLSTFLQAFQTVNKSGFLCILYEILWAH
jgi:NO-binding membrane sensor protein with MHYT domain